MIRSSAPHSPDSPPTLGESSETKPRKPDGGCVSADPPVAAGRILHLLLGAVRRCRSPLPRLRAPGSFVRPLPDVRIAAAALRATLDAASPRGPAVRAALRTLVHAARRAGYPAAQLTPLLGETLLPLLRTRHPGPPGDWLWERLIAWARQDYLEIAPPAAPDEPAAAGVGFVRTNAAAVRTAGAGAAGAGSPDARPVVYRLDGRDLITRVNAAWRDFAEENGAPSLGGGAVGTSLWAHVEGAETQALYRGVHAAVRRSGRPVTLPFRCDAPEERRWMELTVHPLGGGHLQVVSALVRRAAWPRVPLLDPAVPRGPGQFVMCSWCKRVRLDAGGASTGARDTAAAVRPGGHGGGPWVDVVGLPAVRPDAGLPRLVHDACPDCAADVRAVLASA